MDIPSDRHYNDKKGTEVVRMISTVERPVIKQAEKNQPTPENKKRKSARDIQEKIGVYGAFNKTLLDLHQQGR